MKLSCLKHNYLFKLLYNRINPFTGVILMLHRVVEIRSIIDDNRKLEITPDFLEQTIEHYKSKGFYFASLDEVYEIQQSLKKIDRPYVCFTFDDGFRDNLTLAYPIFEKHNIPFTIYVATAFPDKTIFVWWYWLENLILQCDKLRISENDILNTDTVREKNEVFLQIKSAIQKLANDQSRLFIQHLFELNGLRMDNEVSLLDWADIRELNKSNICSIGSHGVTHSSLVALDEKSQMMELKQSKHMLEEQLGCEINHFAYPFGDMNESIAKALKDCRYWSAVRIDGGMQRRKQNIFQMKRTILLQP